MTKKKEERPAVRIVLKGEWIKTGDGSTTYVTVLEKLWGGRESFAQIGEVNPTGPVLGFWWSVNDSRGKYPKGGIVTTLDLAREAAEKALQEE